MEFLYVQIFGNRVCRRQNGCFDRLNDQKQQTKTFDEKIDDLKKDYTDAEVLMLKRIFAIIDKRYGKKSYETFVKNIKESVLNDLKK